MTKSWIKNILDEIDPQLIGKIKPIAEFERPIIEVRWTILSVEEVNSEFGRDALIITAIDDQATDEQIRDIVILDQFYPVGIKSLGSMVGQKIVGVNPMFEYERNGQPALLCKYARVIMGGKRKVNPHVGIKNQEHTTLTNVGEDRTAGHKPESSARAPFSANGKSASIDQPMRVRMDRAVTLRRGEEVSPHPDVAIRWL